MTAMTEKKCKKSKDAEAAFRSRLTASLLSVLLCAAAFVSSSFAWFTMSVGSGTENITAMNYTLAITYGENQPVGNFIYTFSEAGEQTFTLTAGNSENSASTGFCKITIGENIYYTTQINKSGALSLKISAPAGTKVTFEPCWGISSGNGTLYGGETAIVIPGTDAPENTPEPTTEAEPEPTEEPTAEPTTEPATEPATEPTTEPTA